MSHSPFRKPDASPESNRRLWSHLFARGKDASPELGEQARECIDWNEHPETRRFVEWLESEILRPARTETQGQLLLDTARGNTFKEILERIRAGKKAAESFRRQHAV